MTTIPNIGDLVTWILKNKKGDAFKNYSEEKIVSLIYASFYDRCLAYTQDEITGEFTGVVCGIKTAYNKTVTIHDILTTKPGVVKQMMKKFNSLYPGYSLTGTCRGRARIFNNSDKLERRLQ